MLPLIFIFPTPSPSMEKVKSPGSSGLEGVNNLLPPIFIGPRPLCTSILNLDGQSLLPRHPAWKGLKSQVVMVWKGLITCYLQFDLAR